MAGRPSFRNVISNWRTYDGTVAEKVRLTIKNNVTKAVRRQNCCGHPGEPGC